MTTSSAQIQLEEAMRNYVESLNIGEDKSLAETPKRFVKQLGECLEGYNSHPDTHLKVFDNNGYHDLVLVKDITFSSLCEHHMVPFYGTVDVGYVPENKILGLSKFARITDTISKRLQVQERITGELANILEKSLMPRFLFVRITAKHMCMCVRGVLRPESNTVTLTTRGDLETYGHHLTRFK
jgi:GTP cyclohydrolase I